MVDKAKKRLEEVVNRVYAINVHKCLHGCTFKNGFESHIGIWKKATGMMDIRVDVKLSEHVWS
ncbi:hypothetical protein ACB094_11G142000 [Castanea mollissima]